MKTYYEISYFAFNFDRKSTYKHKQMERFANLKLYVTRSGDIPVAGHTQLRKQ